MIELFTDIELHNKLDGHLLDENKVYFVRLKVHDPGLIEKETTKGQCSEFIRWHPNNLVGQIIFRDVAGHVNLFGGKYEVKSTKLLTNLSGNHQVEYLLNDISKYSSTLVFSPAASSSFIYKLDPKKLTSNKYYIYKYLSSNLFQNRKDSLQHLLDLILSNPHFSQHATHSYIPTFSTKKFNHLTFQRIAGKLSDSEFVPPGHELASKPFFAQMPNTEAGEKILPKRLYSVTNRISYDTPENRFLKYFLIWCQGIYMNVYNTNHRYQVREDCEKSLKIIRKYLYHPFFKEIGLFSFLPISSSILANRTGYQELFLHYLKCRSQPRIFNDYLTEIVSTMEIKNMSILYEYWVFFRIAEELFGNDAALEIIGYQNIGNSVRYGLKISRGSYKLYYNKTYGHSPDASYSFSLRPDISLEIDKEGKTFKYFFDAKYSNTSIPSIEDEPVVVYRNVNVVKMLSYLESINKSYMAVIVYPGTKFSFYNRNYFDSDNFFRSPDLITDFEGVGALPLSPGHTKSIELFHSFMNQFKSKLSINL